MYTYIYIHIIYREISIFSIDKSTIMCMLFNKCMETINLLTI